MKSARLADELVGSLTCSRLSDDAKVRIRPQRRLARIERLYSSGVPAANTFDPALIIIPFVGPFR